MKLFRAGAAILALALIAGCGHNEARSLAMKGPTATTSVAALGFAPDASDGAFPLFQSFAPVSSSPLNGRTLEVSHISDIVLQPKEVVLTFDDGPIPGKTHKILRALDDYGVGATFLMVGQMARAYPKIAQDVALHGHTIGTHTEGHANLRTLSADAAIAEIHRGQRSVSAALAPIGRRPAPFFRFPYLADTRPLRERLSGEGVVAIDVDIDSKDYFRDAPSIVRDRTLLSLEKHGRGIVLFHDIQSRTAAMLPDFLQALQERGFKVVRLVPAGRPSGPMLLSDASF
ncbi:polysaccharide deacetylase family protein [Aurantimonas coralicida]|uniref:polysaccharide deacetylase family protein n=1 Tax=Aurantimonas coralicida TaxID=182270 RepID=UPI0023A21EB9|nr:polysaccharide deacetylase family protein [Aurantimonas coralicida]MDE0922029.1 polysaccharide deacetylase family protein [Aurantimonas coralicida]